MKKKLLHSAAICRMTLILSTVMLMTSCYFMPTYLPEPDYPEEEVEDWEYSNLHYPNSAHVFYKAATDGSGHIYDAVQIGNQVWLTENLRTGLFSQDTTTFLNRATPTQCASSTEPCYWPGFDAKSGEPHPGFIYNYAAVTFGEGNQGPCPNGWHVPSKADWDELKNYMFSQPMYGYQDCNECIAKALCWASDVWNDENSSEGTPGNNWASNNASGFSAVPSHGPGSRWCSFFWSTTKTNDTMAYIYTLSSWETIFDFESAKTNRDMHSIRCIRD